MGLLNRIFGRPSDTDKGKRKSINLAFVLLSEAQIPRVEEIQQAYGAFAAADDTVASLSDTVTGAQSGKSRVLSLRLSTGETVMVALMPSPVPNGEADRGAKFSLSSFRNGWKLPPHCAHLIVTFSGLESDPPVVQLSRFTSVLAAVVQVSPAVGVYWGNAGATHDSKFFLSIASDPGIVPRIMLWTGVSVGRESDGRLSFLSVGMRQLALPDLLLIARDNSAGAALETMFDLLAYVADRGVPIREGETVGRTSEERLSVSYVRSPLDPTKKVWRIVLSKP